VHGARLSVEPAAELFEHGICLGDWSQQPICPHLSPMPRCTPRSTGSRGSPLTALSQEIVARRREALGHINRSDPSQPAADGCHRFEPAGDRHAVWNMCGAIADCAEAGNKGADLQALLKTGGTGLEPATPGVTGRYCATGCGRLRPGITGYSRHSFAERIGCDRLHGRLPPGTAFVARRVVESVPISTTR
jgi:hypothetical protein